MIKDFFKIILYQPLFNLLVFFAWLVPGHSMGWAIIIMTLLLKTLMWKLQAKPLKSQLEMRAHQGEIKAIQEKFKEDRAAQSQAVMAYYKQHGINPLAGCLPLLIQLPILIVLYRVFMVGVSDLRPDLLYSFTPHLEVINPFFLGADLSKPDAWLWPLIAAGAQFLQSRTFLAFNPPAPTAGGKSDPMVMMNKQMLYLFPVVTFFFARIVPSGLAVYWAVSAIFQTAQQIYIFRTYKVAQAAASVTVREKSSEKTKPRAKKKK
jgi:YidC/Oxa1 family membrane protein insertase